MLILRHLGSEVEGLGVLGLQGSDFGVRVHGSRFLGHSV